MPFNAILKDLSELTGGMPIDHLKLFISLVLCYPYAALFNRLPNNPTLKHLFSIVITTITFVWFHEQYIGSLHLLFITLFTYGVTYFWRSSRAALVVFAACMLHMSYSHIVRQMKGHLGDADFDHSGPQMVLTIKLTSFAFNVWDGTRPDNVLTPYNISKRVKNFPSLVEFLGWAFFFGGFLTGPACEFMDYKNFVEMKVFEVEEKDGRKKIKKPSGLKPALYNLLTSIIYITYFASIGVRYNLIAQVKRVFPKSSLLLRFFYIQLGAFNSRVKYYIVWTLADGACILCGLGFNGYDSAGHPLWDRVKNIDAKSYETAQNCKELLESWNMRTNVWLRNHVYLRVAKPGKRPGFKSTLATFATSALWHGFHPGYYLTFITGAINQHAAKLLRRTLRPLFLTPDLQAPLPSKKFYDFAGWFTTQITFNYTAIPFEILSLEGSYAAWRSVFFYGHVGIITVEVLNSVLVGPYLRSIQKKRAATIGLSVKEVKSKDVLVSELGVPESTDGVQISKAKEE